MSKEARMRTGLPPVVLLFMLGSCPGATGSDHNGPSPMTAGKTNSDRGRKLTVTAYAPKFGSASLRDLQGGVPVVARLPDECPGKEVR
jgi:hypothetical protein